MVDGGKGDVYTENVTSVPQEPRRQLVGFRPCFPIAGRAGVPVISGLYTHPMPWLMSCINSWLTESQENPR